MNHVIHTFGELACFTRPELKVERFSYPCITPSAARGIFDAIYMKPLEFRWEISRIEVLNLPRFIALRRNEVKEKASTSAITDWMNGEAEPEPLWADADRGMAGSDERGRTQRQTMALRRPAYRLHARILPWPRWEREQPAFDAQFRRRALGGKCFQQPYFGCREFPAYFELVEDLSQAAPPAPFDLDIGLMLYDVFDLSRPGNAESQPSISFFDAKVRGGTLDVPSHASSLVLKSTGRA